MLGCLVNLNYRVLISTTRGRQNLRNNNWITLCFQIRYIHTLAYTDTHTHTRRPTGLTPLFLRSDSRWLPVCWWPANRQQRLWGASVRQYPEFGEPEFTGPRGTQRGPGTRQSKKGPIWHEWVLRVSATHSDGYNEDKLTTYTQRMTTLVHFKLFPCRALWGRPEASRGMWRSCLVQYICWSCRHTSSGGPVAQSSTPSGSCGPERGSAPQGDVVS